MTRNRTRFPGIVAAFVILCALALAPSRTDACSCRVDKDYGFVSAGDLIPSNSRGVLWWGSFDGSAGADEVLPVQIATALGKTLPVAYELVSKDYFRSLWLFRPQDGFETGKRYVFTTKRSRLRDAEYQRISVTVSDKPAESPTDPVALELGEVTTDLVGIAAGGSCQDVVTAATRRIAMRLPQELEAFRDQLYFETVIDGADNWIASGSICAPRVPGESWIGKGVDLLYRVCGDARGTRSLPAGPHTVEIRAHLPGTPVRVVSTAVAVELACSKHR